MDVGHYNCRDYYISPRFAPTTLTSEHRPPPYRHESYAELEYRSRSPASFKPKFPLMRLPLELRQEIFRYLLPRTRERVQSNPLASHARKFSAVQKRGTKGMAIPIADGAGTNTSVTNVVWQRGNINLFSVCRQLHNECAEMVYGNSTFLLFVTYSGITFRFRWLLPNGLAPIRSFSFLELLPERHLTLIKRVVVHVDHVDSYLGMIKFNVGGNGLTHGLRKQAQRLVDALRGPVPPQHGTATGECHKLSNRDGNQEVNARRLAKISIHVPNGNAVLDSIKSDKIRQRDGVTKVAEDVEAVLEPFGQLCGVRDVSINGAITDDFARKLEEKMRSTESVEYAQAQDADDDELAAPQGVHLCVYGNNI